MKVDYSISTKLNNREKIYPRILQKKNIKEDSKLKELWNISTKPKKKRRRKILKLKELCFPDTLSDKFQ